jgi:hypothetical protein
MSNSSRFASALSSRNAENGKIDHSFLMMNTRLAAEPAAGARSVATL